MVVIGGWMGLLFVIKQLESGKIIGDGDVVESNL